MKPMYKVWLDNNGKVFGKGPFLLLKEVENTGSLSEAAKRLSMSYNKAHNLIKSIERNLDTKLLIKKIGGVNGGSSTLTPEAKKLMDNFEKFQEECGKYIEKCYNQYFNY